MAPKVLLFLPNIVGYVRICLLFSAWTVRHAPAAFLPVYLLSIILDAVDGWLARRLGQTSGFGAWLDVVVDNLGRSMLWSLVSEWGWLLSSLEWCVFVCNHSEGGERWKSSFSSSPRVIQAVMADGFRTPLGVWVVSGLHGLPVWLYLCGGGGDGGVLEVSWWLQAAGMLLLAAGRLLALTAELWCLWTHIKHLTRDQPEDKRS
ncbi:uncharacterized protein LOC115400274 isoform X1 [Salarias fasciatus]|uniref:uncharacterized protein LOC115400274 isoform X1 n=1 Tax=Salarias fasciatus TaxID=181472 RepID=UPI001176E804|nr:uncharacterized protein LOC115400274 isoform X1 [Salarias fasciatus]